ncbi:MAG: hypothetical protein ACRERX_23660 [Pseudomonas sp.]
MIGLLTRAKHNFSTVSIEWVEEYSEIFSRAFERRLPLDLPAGSESTVTLEAQRTGPAGMPPSRHECRAWWRRPCNWRDERRWDGGALAISVSDGATASAYVSSLHTLYTNQRTQRLVTRIRSLLQPQMGYQLPTVENRLQNIPLLDPSFLASWELATLGELKYLDRSCFRIGAVRTNATPGPVPWHWVDEYEVLVDQEVGVLLRYAGIVDGEQAASLSVRSVHFNDPIPDEVFSYEPPEGTKTIWV